MKEVQIKLSQTNQSNYIMCSVDDHIVASGFDPVTALERAQDHIWKAWNTREQVARTE